MVRRPRRLVHGPRFDGARALDRFLRDNDLSVPSFCEAHGFERLPVERLISGDAKRPAIGLLLRLQEVTGGAVAVDAWAPESRREDQPDEVPGAMRRGAADSLATESGEHPASAIDPTGTDAP